MPDRKTFSGEFAGPVHLFFGLSYASYLVLPRLAIQNMPDDWQQRFVGLLEELDAALGQKRPPDNYRISATDGHGNFVADPARDYRHGVIKDIYPEFDRTRGPEADAHEINRLCRTDTTCS